MKYILFFVFTLFFILFGLIPEFVMYFTWNLIDPTSEASRIVVLLAFWFIGGGLCVFFAAVAFIFWAASVKALSESRWL